LPTPGQPPSTQLYVTLAVVLGENELEEFSQTMQVVKMAESEPMALSPDVAVLDVIVQLAMVGAPP
jgi:hypothetical protein